MAPSMMSKGASKHLTNEASPEIGSRSSRKNKQRKKNLTDEQGLQWTRGELHRFYDAYRKHGRDLKKVAAAVRNRSVDMVKALFTMNRAYLSLPEGTASVAGFVAMMADHYGVMEGSDGEGEGHQKRKRAKVPPSDLGEEFIPPHSISSAQRCLPFLKQTKAYGIEWRATGKRTPRFPVRSPYERDDREGCTPPNKIAKKSLDADDALRRGGRSSYRRTENDDSTLIRLGKMSQAKETHFKHHDSSMFENGVKITRERRHKKGATNRDRALLNDMEGFGSVEVPQKRKIVRVDDTEGNDSDDIANERLKTRRQNRMVEAEVSPDELVALEVLSVLLPAGLMESESSPQLKEKRIANNVDEKSHTLETVSTNRHREKAIHTVPEDSLVHAISAADDTQPKSMHEPVDGNAFSAGELGNSKIKRKTKVLRVEASNDSVEKRSVYDQESAEDENLKALEKASRASQGPAKQLKIAKTSEESSLTSDKKITGPDAVVSATQVSGSGVASLPQKPPNRRKLSLKKSLQGRAKSFETTHDKPHSYQSFSGQELLKEKVSTYLSYPLVRQRCIFEWFYSAIDYPWFAKSELTDYLDHLGISHVARLTRLEWSVIKSSMGRPRRLSDRFIQKERDNLKEYRESVRKQYTELREGVRDGIATEFPRPLSVGSRVIAIHPKTQEICDGKILIVDHNKYNVLFDELGADLVMDIDCMPLNPLEYIPEGLRRQICKCSSTSKVALLDRRPTSDASVPLAPSMLDNVSFSTKPPIKKDVINRPILHGEVSTTNITEQHITTNSKARGTETQRAQMVQHHTSDTQEMEPEMIEIFSCSKSKAQAMVDAAMKAASSVKKAEHQPLDKHQEHTNGSLDHHHQSQSLANTAEPMSNGFISKEGSDKNETQIPLELITSSVATCLMIQMCTEKQYPPGDVAQLMETAVSGLQPKCAQNMSIYREIQTCLSLIKIQIMLRVRT